MPLVIVIVAIWALLSALYVAYLILASLLLLLARAVAALVRWTLGR